MQLRGNNNAVSAAFATVVLVYVGCAIALFGIVSNIESSLLKFGLIAYLFVAGPILLAAYCGGLTTVKNKNFTLTPPSHMAGKRVKPRLRRLVYVRIFIAFAAMLGAFVFVIWAGGHFDFFSERSRWAEMICTGIPLLVYVLAHVAFTFVSMRLGWVTRQEAGELLTAGRRWPDTWLEPIDDNSTK